MKKMLALFLVICISAGCLISCGEEKPATTKKPTAAPSMLTPSADDGAESAIPETSETPEVSETPTFTGTPDITETPEVTETSKVTEEPKATEKPKATDRPIISVDYECNTEKFTNPIASRSVPDPFITYDIETGYYYALYTMGNRIELFRHKHVAKVFSEGESKVIYKATGENDVWGDIWAPEMHRGTDGLWYLYSSSRITKEESNKKIFVLGSSTSDPFKSEWEFKGRPLGNEYGIDPTIYTAPNGTRYMCYSGFNQYGQVLKIAKMKNEYTCESPRMIAKAELDWELVPPYVNQYAILEGAFFVQKNGRLFIIYSANGCWSEHYALGVLEFTGSNMLSVKSWTKHPEPLFVLGNGVYGPGHASFFYSPDNSEVWCAYHGMSQPNPSSSPAERYCHVQKIEFDKNGYPVMGKPIGPNVQIAPPSGERK